MPWMIRKAARASNMQLRAMSVPPLLHTDDRGLFCEAGGFHIDPWRPVGRAVISHAHGDHAPPGT
jgi:putative mRNA 3-end processing factor